MFTKYIFVEVIVNLTRITKRYHMRNLQFIEKYCIFSKGIYFLCGRIKKDKIIFFLNKNIYYYLG